MRDHADAPSLERGPGVAAGGPSLETGLDDLGYTMNEAAGHIREPKTTSPLPGLGLTPEGEAQ